MTATSYMMSKSCHVWPRCGLSARLNVFIAVFVVIALLMIGAMLVVETSTPFPESPYPSVVMTSPPNVTIVTAYFVLGDLPGKHGLFPRRVRDFLAWADAYAYLINPLVVYTDSDLVVDKFRRLRKEFMQSTVIIKIDRKELWPFQLEDKIRAIYAQADYPKFSPNTVMPEYTCTQHAKYACLELALGERHFRSRYIAWMDVGYFRKTLHRRRHFVIVPPRDFDETKVAMNLVFPSAMTVSAEQVFKENLVWIGGGMAFGTRSQISTLVTDYRRAVEFYLSQGLSNTDQQVLYAMNLPRERQLLKPRVELQLYHWNRWPWESGWFHLGYSCYREIQI